MHLLHYLSTRPRRAGTERKEWLIIEKKKMTWLLTHVLVMLTLLLLYISCPNQISPPISHAKSQTPSPNTLVRLPFRKALVTSTTSQSSMWKGWGQFMLYQSLLVGLPRIASLTRYRWGARYLTYEWVLKLFLVGHRELGTLKWLLTISCLNMWL